MEQFSFWCFWSSYSLTFVWQLHLLIRVNTTLLQKLVNPRICTCIENTTIKKDTVLYFLIKGSLNFMFNQNLDNNGHYGVATISAFMELIKKFCENSVGT